LLVGGRWSLVAGRWSLVVRRVAPGELSSCPFAGLPVCPKVRSLFLPAAIIALVAQFAVLWAVIAGRAPASSPGRPARLAEIAWVVLPTLVLIGVLFLTWNRMAAPVVVAPVAGVTA